MAVSSSASGDAGAIFEANDVASSVRTFAASDGSYAVIAVYEAGVGGHSALLLLNVSDPVNFALVDRAAHGRDGFETCDTLNGIDAFVIGSHMYVVVSDPNHGVPAGWHDVHLFRVNLAMPQP